MRRGIVVIGALLLMAACGGRDAWMHDPLPERGDVVAPAPIPAGAPRVRLQTSVGDIVLALYADRAPITVANFLRYVDEGFYDGTIFHRVVWEDPGPAMIQGGGLTADLEPRPTREPIENEARGGISNARGTIAMARLPAAHSATAQFFINYLDNPALDHRNENNYGYAVFGVVVEGMDVVDRISMVPTEPAPGTPHRNVPMVDIVIERASRAS